LCVIKKPRKRGG